MKIRVLGTGLSGMVGSRVVQLLGEEFEFFNFSLEEGRDILDREALARVFLTFRPSFCLHFAAKTDVDACEKEKNLGEESESFKINVLGTKNIVDLCQRSGVFLLYISTDFVFDGRKKRPYIEADRPNPINWYGKTKLLGEKEVEKLGGGFSILRIAYPFRANFPGKMDFVRAILARLKKGKEVLAISDHVFTPTFIDDFAYALRVLLREKIEGLFHLVGSSHLTPYQTALEIASVFNLNKSLVRKTSLEQYFLGRAPRPPFLALSNKKISVYNVAMSSFKEGLLEVKRQMEGR